MAEDMRTLEQAAELLRGQPWGWSVSVEYPGYGLVTFSAEVFGVFRAYAFGFANPTLTVDRVDEQGASVNGESVDTGAPCCELDGYGVAVHVAAAIERMERCGESR